MKELRYRDRETGELRAERVFSERELTFLYEHPVGRRLEAALFSRGPFNHLYGWLKRRPQSAAKIPGFVRSLGIDASEADRPLEAFESLDAFFTRRLKPGARPIDPTPEHLLAPADGRVLVYPVLDGRRLRVKGSEVDLSTLVGSADLAARYAGGTAVVVRLAPADYHRFHFASAGVAGPPRTFPGRLHSVHPIALHSGAPSFANKRSWTTLATDRFGTLLQVEVGAIGVGTIVQTYTPGPVERGAEKGTFRFGGSTVILLVEPGQVEVDADLHEATSDGLETFVKVGTRIGRCP